MKTKTTIIVIVVLALLALGISALVKDSKKPGKYDAFATCIKDSGALFYGAFWCPHCQEQKALFGSKSQKLLPYVECSTPDANGQLQVCIDQKIESYPTWIFTDGTRQDAVIDLETLAEKTSCTLPQE